MLSNRSKIEIHLAPIHFLWAFTKMNKKVSYTNQYLSRTETYKKKNHTFRCGFFLAEKEGFEPSKRFRRLHDFQSCALDQLGDFSIAVKRFLLIHLCHPIDSVIIIAKKDIMSSPKFCVLKK